MSRGGLGVVRRGARVQQIYFYGMKASLVSPPVIVFPLCCRMDTGGGAVEVVVVEDGGDQQGCGS